MTYKIDGMTLITYKRTKIDWLGGVKDGSAMAMQILFWVFLLVKTHNSPMVFLVIAGVLIWATYLANKI